MNPRVGTISLMMKKGDVLVFPNNVSWFFLQGIIRKQQKVFETIQKENPALVQHSNAKQSELIAQSHQVKRNTCKDKERKTIRENTPSLTLLALPIYMYPDKLFETLLLIHFVRYISATRGTRSTLS